MMRPVSRKWTLKILPREGLDVPGVNFSLEQKLKIARLLDQAQCLKWKW
jgi:isopropylmalate/homocitrate/citramalate synthase